MVSVLGVIGILLSEDGYRELVDLAVERGLGIGEELRKIGYEETYSRIVRLLDKYLPHKILLDTLVNHLFLTSDPRVMDEFEELVKSVNIETISISPLFRIIEERPMSDINSVYNECKDCFSGIVNTSKGEILLLNKDRYKIEVEDDVGLGLDPSGKGIIYLIHGKELIPVSEFIVSNNMIDPTNDSNDPSSPLYKGILTALYEISAMTQGLTMREILESKLEDEINYYRVFIHNYVKVRETLRRLGYTVTPREDSFGSNKNPIVIGVKNMGSIAVELTVELDQDPSISIKIYEQEKFQPHVTKWITRKMWDENIIMGNIIEAMERVDKIILKSLEELKQRRVHLMKPENYPIINLLLDRDYISYYLRRRLPGVLLADTGYEDSELIIPVKTPYKYDKKIDILVDGDNITVNGEKIENILQTDNMPKTLRAKLKILIYIALANIQRKLENNKGENNISITIKNIPQDITRLIARRYMPHLSGCWDIIKALPPNYGRLLAFQSRTKNNLPDKFLNGEDSTLLKITCCNPILFPIYDTLATSWYGIQDNSDPDVYLYKVNPSNPSGDKVFLVIDKTSPTPTLYPIVARNPVEAKSIMRREKGRIDYRRRLNQLPTILLDVTRFARVGMGKCACKVRVPLLLEREMREVANNVNLVHS